MAPENWIVSISSYHIVTIYYCESTSNVITRLDKDYTLVKFQWNLVGCSRLQVPSQVFCTL